MTTIIGGKCTDGVVLIADRKVIHQDDRDTYRDKIFSPYYPIAIASAGNNDLIDKFIRTALERAQNMHEKFSRGSFAPISGAVFWDRSQDANRAINYIEYLNELEDVVRSINDAHKYGLDSNSLIDCLIGVWTRDRGSKLSYISPKGLQSDVGDHRVIGSGEPYSHVFLRSLLEPSEQLTMFEFAKNRVFRNKMA
jgi:20S proteasome alpha/beta subunit